MIKAVASGAGDVAGSMLFFSYKLHDHDCDERCGLEAWDGVGFEFFSGPEGEGKSDLGCGPCNGGR